PQGIAHRRTAEERVVPRVARRRCSARQRGDLRRADRLPVKTAVEAALAAIAVTGAVTAASAFVPDRYVATVVGFVFLAATWLLVWRGDDARVERSELSLGGLVLPGPLDRRRLA